MTGPIAFVRGLRRPEAFHGADVSSGFFEGWYVKLVSADLSQRWAVIPGIFRGLQEPGQPSRDEAFVQVLDGSTGQNAFEQAKQFTQATQVTSLAITKLDGTAKGGVVIGISDQFKIPVRYIGVGEGIDQLQVFDRKEFVDSLFG